MRMRSFILYSIIVTIGTTSVVKRGKENYRESSAAPLSASLYIITHNGIYEKFLMRFFS